MVIIDQKLCLAEVQCFGVCFFFCFFFLVAENRGHYKFKLCLTRIRLLTVRGDGNTCMYSGWEMVEQLPAIIKAFGGDQAQWLYYGHNVNLQQ